MPSRWRIAWVITARWRWRSNDRGRLITISDDNVSVKFVPVVLAVAAALAVLPANASSAKPQKPVCQAGVERPVGSVRDAFAAVAKADLQAFKSPGGAAQSSFGKLNVNGYPTT